MGLAAADLPTSTAVVRAATPDAQPLPLPHGAHLAKSIKWGDGGVFLRCPTVRSK